MQPQKLFLSNKMRQFPIALLLSIPIALNVAPAYLSARESEVRLEFEGFQEVKLAIVVSTEYIGDCPGAKRVSVTHFVSSYHTASARFAGSNQKCHTRLERRSSSLHKSQL